MLVRELIAELQKFDGDTEVLGFLMKPTYEWRDIASVEFSDGRPWWDNRIGKWGEREVVGIGFKELERYSD